MVDRSASRAAVMDWRDSALLEMMALIHAASGEAMAALEAQIDGIAWSEAYYDPEGAACKFVRPAMRQSLTAPVDRWFTERADALAQIDPGLAPIAADFANLDTRPALPVEAEAAEAPVSSWTPAWLLGPLDTIRSAAERAGEVAAYALPDSVRANAGHLSTLLGQEIGARSGAHEWLRDGGRAELSRTWSGPSTVEEASARPYLTQLIDRVDRTVTRAKEFIG